MINYFDYLKFHNEFKNAEPFNHVIIDNFFDEETALKLSSEFPDYDDPKIWSVYKNAIEDKKLTPNWDLFPKTTYQAFSLMNTPVEHSRWFHVCGRCVLSPAMRMTGLTLIKCPKCAKL